MSAGGPPEDAAPPDRGDEAALVEFGRWLFAQECSFVAGAASADTLPPAGLPEAGFAGRSNVGKSSLLNALTGRRTLARTSHTPGRTRQLNFFDLGGRLMLVDLPGYGYARAAKHEIAGWTRLIQDYLRGRPTLRRLCLLVDARHGLKDSDREIATLLDETAVPYQVVLTKADKAKGVDELQAEVAAEMARRPACHPEVIATSSVTGAGIAELRAALAGLVERTG